MAETDNGISLGQYSQTLDGVKDTLNQSILSIAPEAWQSSLTSILPAHWQEWLLPLMGGPFFIILSRMVLSSASR